MNVLHLYPKQTGTRPIHVTIPKRFTYFWEIGAYLSQRDACSIDSLDPEYSMYYLTKHILEHDIKIIIMLTRVENLNQSLKFASFIKSIRDVNICVYGDIVNFIPDFFKEQECFDAVVTGGDWEISLLSYIDHVRDEANEPSGVYVRKDGKEYPGVSFEGAQWPFPDVKQIPVELYNRLNGKKELSFTVARGCPFDCKFCLSTCTFGNKERRKSVVDVVDYMQSNADTFDSFKLFAPTFNLDNTWVREFCEELIRRDLGIRWCATSRINLLDDESLVALMAKSGCYKISVGLETINQSSRYLKKVFSKEQIQRVADLFKKNGMILKGLVMLGVPHQTKEDIIELFTLMKESGIHIRPTSYSPLSNLKDKEKLSSKEIIRYDKFTYYDQGIEGVSKEQFFRLITDAQNFEEILR